MTMYELIDDHITFESRQALANYLKITTSTIKYAEQHYEKNGYKTFMVRGHKVRKIEMVKKQIDTKTDEHYSVKDIMLWHEQTFPDATLQDQKAKFVEERTEYRSSGELSELADMYIVACGMARFPSLDAQIAFHQINEVCLNKAIHSPILLDAVDAKMEVNKQRLWTKDSKVGYKHIA